MSKSLTDEGYITVPYKISPRPDWVVAREPVGHGLSEHESPQSYSLLDYQIRVGVDESACYHQMRVQINDESCIEDMSQFLYNVVPGAQRLVFHRCVIQRNEQSIDCLDLENIRCMRRETELERHVSSDQLTVELIIDDLRVGDQVEIETTFFETSGDHPLYGHYFHRGYRASWGVPVSLQSVRVTNSSEDRNLTIQYLDSARSIDEKKALVPEAVFEKQWSDITPQMQGACLPVHYWPPYLIIVTENNWPSVSAYLHSYYSGQGVMDCDLDLAGIDELAVSVASDESIMQCVRFVQDSIRYRSETSGIFSHTPKEPAITLKRRTGDCKDKSNLLVALLAGIGVKAELTLVNTSLHDAIDMLAPSPFLFDHMIVKVSWNNQDYFIDATSQKQGGQLTSLADLPYRKALVLSASGSDLINIPRRTDLHVVSIKHTVDLRRNNDNGPTVAVERTFYRNRANNMRYYFASTSMKLLETDYLEDLSESLGVQLVALEPVHVSSDDLTTNTLVARELYKIESPLKKIKGGLLEIATTFYSDLQIPSTDANPVAIQQDGVMEHHIQVLYDHKSSVDEEQFQCDTEWFKYEDKVIVNKKELNFHMRLTPGQGVVPIDKLKQYREHYKSVYERSVSRFAVSTSSFGMLGQLFLAGAIVIMLKIAQINGLFG